MLRSLYLARGARAALALAAALAACTFEDVSVEERPIARVYITDQDGKRWDITQAVHRFGYDARRFYFGFGLSAIPPLVDPPLVAPGDSAFAPADSSFPVVGVVVGADARAYGVAELTNWAVVDDRVGGAAVALVHQPASGAFDAWRRVVGTDTLTLGHSGWVYADQTVLYDRETESMWHRIAGTSALTCIAGAHAGKTLVPQAAEESLWPAWLSAHPQTKLLYIEPVQPQP